MNNNKENATQEFIEMVKQAWTYARLTEEEKQRLIECLQFAKIGGTFDQRWAHLHDIFNAFLQGCGYSWNKLAHKLKK